ncbi:helix-turn-helix domain-containing protein [Roseiflexus sp.]
MTMTDAEKPSRRFYTTTEAAEYLTNAGIKCKRGAVRKWIVEGKLRGVKFGDTWYVSKAELDRFLDRLESERRTLHGVLG